MTDETDLAKLVNRSGFLFQVAVEEHVRAASTRHEWQVLAREYPWRASDGSRSGFIDFVVGRNVLRAVVECKRTQGGEWVFLVPEPATETPRLRTLWAYRTDERVGDIGWGDFLIDPIGFTSGFCSIRGASDDDKPMLERISSELVRASESLAREELSMARRHAGQCVYIPLIVTNAKLFVCRVTPGEVDLSTGTLPPTARFEEVNSIKFRKALSTEVAPEPSEYETFESGLALKERCAVVVNVAHLNDWLANVRERSRSAIYSNGYPWDYLRK